MDDFDLTYEGFTPDPIPSQPKPYRPPRLDDADTVMPARPSHAVEERFQPIDDEPPRREPFKGKPRTDQATASPTPEAATTARTDERNRRIEELRRKKAEDDRPSAIVRFFTDERMRLFLASVLLITSIFVVVAIFSHFVHGSEDQSEITNLTLSEIAGNPGSIENAGGGFGAWLSYVLLCDALGLGSLVMLPYMWILAFSLLGVRKCNFWGTTFRCLLVAIASSIVLGFITYTWGTETYWGGIHGYYVNKFLFDNATWIGALLVSVFLIVIVCIVYINELRIVWNKWRDIYRRHQAQERLRREQRRELERLEAEEAEEARRAEAKRRAQNRASQEHEVAETITPDTANAATAADSATTDTEDVTDQDMTGGYVVGDVVVVDGDYHDSDAYEVGATDSDDVLVIDGANTHSEVSGQEAHGQESTRTPGVDDEIFRIDESSTGTSTQVDETFTVNAPEIEEADNTVVQTVPESTGRYDHRAELAHYQFPPIDLLEDRPSGAVIDMDEQQANKALIEKTLLDYKIPISRIEATVGPTVTLYEIVPAEGVRISQIKRLEDDIALSLKALGIRIIAPIPGKGTVGIEVPNNDPQTVSMRAVINSKKFQECKMALPMAMGATISNDIFIADMAKMPHLLVAGATGMGKSVGLNAIIASLVYKKHPSELKFVLIDPKMVEFSLYSRLEHHFLAKLPNEEDAIITDMKKVIQTLNSLCVEMDQRYELLRNANVRSLEEYNRKFTDLKLNQADGHRYLPYIVVVVDEFADLIMTQGKEVEQPIARIAQKARAVGIHMILATQRPSTNVITGLIKANFPGRIAFRVIQMVDSRTILDCPGANQLIGRGDMLFSHNGSMERVQCAFISTEEVEALTEYIDSQVGYEHAYYLPEFVPDEAEGGPIAGASMDRDPLFNEAARFVVTRQLGSTSSLQRQFGIGYNRAGKLMDQMEAAGIVGPVNGAKPRSILMDTVTLESILGD